MEPVKHRIVISLQDQNGRTLYYTDKGDFSCSDWEAKTYCSRGIHSALHQLNRNKEVKRLKKEGFELKAIDKLDKRQESNLAALRRETQNPDPEPLVPEPIEYLDFGVPLSFGYTAEYLPQKSVTRRDWKVSHANKFINAFERAGAGDKKLRVPAVDKAYHRGGKQIGWAILSHAPYKEALKDMPRVDLVAEGGMCKSVNEFVTKYFKGDLEKEVWVVGFRFQPLEDERLLDAEVCNPVSEPIQYSFATDTAEKTPKSQNLEVLTSSKSDEHGTPHFLAYAAREVLGEINLDPMSNPKAQKIIRAQKFYTKEENGLTKPWIGRIWLNPAFSLADEAVAKLIGAYEVGICPEALLLIKA
ncbi:hypothetical protein Q5692_37840, partial [Microcoleus sp. C2C3]